MFKELGLLAIQLPFMEHMMIKVQHKNHDINLN